MKDLMLVAALAAAAGMIASSAAEAAKKRKAATVRPSAAVRVDPYVVRDHDGEILGRDPDPFIRLMLLRQGKIQDQNGP